MRDLISMQLGLKFLNGPKGPQIVSVKEGLTIGRENCDINLDDPRVSNPHATVVRSETEGWVVIDIKSKNGLRFEGERTERLRLQPGISFEAGDTRFEAVIYDPKPLKKQRYWYEVLAAFMANDFQEAKDMPRPVRVLDPALVLEFVRGMQLNTRWTLGYGPRKIGASSIDLPIWEPGAPAICFEITPSPDGILFKTKRPDIVQLNGQAVDSSLLHVGDSISILETTIEVDFIV